MKKSQSITLQMIETCVVRAALRLCDELADIDELTPEEAALVALAAHREINEYARRAGLVR